MCFWTLSGWRLFVLYLADKNVRAKLMNEHEDWPQDDSRGPVPEPEWARAIMCPKLAAEGLEDSAANCEVSDGQSSVLLMAAAAYMYASIAVVLFVFHR